MTWKFHATKFLSKGTYEYIHRSEMEDCKKEENKEL